MHMTVDIVDLFNNRLNGKIMILEQYNEYFPRNMLTVHGLFYFLCRY